MREFLKNFFKKDSKNIAEANFWTNEINKYLDWYNGKCALYGTCTPSDEQKQKSHDLKTNAILTWLEFHQKEKYHKDLILEKNAFSGLKILDVGSGPFPSALVFNDCELYCLDPLLPEYMKMKFPFHLYESRAKFVYGRSEEIPFGNHFFDAVISVNAIDHVNDFEKTAQEIKRVLKPKGKIRMHVHYHKPSVAEPLEIDDLRFVNAFNWSGEFKKVFESKEKTGHVLSNKDEKYVVWSNF